MTGVEGAELSGDLAGVAIDVRFWGVTTGGVAVLAVTTF